MFDGIRPYFNSEIPAAMNRIAADPLFPVLAGYVFPGRDVEELREMVRGISSVKEFQAKVMYAATSMIIRKSISRLSVSGLENVSPQHSCIFLSNHRDIMLDAAILQIILVDNGLETSEISFGANLMVNQLVVDIGKSNKMFTVERPGTNMRDFYNSSMKLSAYMRDCVVKRGQSSWLAQRNGRTKDGTDRTDQGIIKMFGMSGGADKLAAIAELNILPVSLSYEWEPCDFLKTLELYDRRMGPYRKGPMEDLNSILQGINQPKGRVHFALCPVVGMEDLKPFANLNASDFHRLVANLIDQRICTAFMLWPNNYVAHDLLNGSDRYSAMYSTHDKEAFLQHMAGLEQMCGNRDLEELRKIFLGIYANPINSRLAFE